MKRIFWAGPTSCAAVAVLVLAPYGVSAALEVFTDRNAFLAIAGPTAYTEDFSTATPGTVRSGETPTFGTLLFSYEGSPDGGNGDAFDGQPLIQDPGDVNRSREFMGEVNVDGTPSGIHTFSFPDPVFAFGGSFSGAITGAKLTAIAAGETVKLSDYLSGRGTGFFGITSSAEFGSVSFGAEESSGSEVFRLDDVVYATRIEEIEESAPVVPLPASFWFLLAGAGALGAVRTGSRAKARCRANWRLG